MAHRAPSSGGTDAVELGIGTPGRLSLAGASVKIEDLRGERVHVDF